MLQVRAIHCYDKCPLTRGIECSDDMHRFIVTDVQKQLTRKRRIIGIIRNDFTFQKSGEYLLTGNAPLHHSLKSVPLPFDASGFYSILEYISIPRHVPGKCLQSRSESQMFN